MSKPLKTIDGMAFTQTILGTPTSGKEYQEYRTPALGNKPGFFGIRDKKTGEIHVPSVYYSYCGGSSQSYWDSETNSTYVKGVWTIQRFESEIKTLLKRYRKKAEDFEMVAFDLKEGMRMSYNNGYSKRPGHIYHAGPSPLSRDEAQNILTIVVLQTSLTPSDEGEVTVSEKNAIVAIEVKEI